MMNAQMEHLVDEQWSTVLHLLPDDLEASALSMGALQRKRAVKSAEQLLRMVLAYGVGELSLRGISAWAIGAGIGEISNVAVLKRLRHCHMWLGYLLCWKIAQNTHLPELYSQEMRLLIVDATCACRPGSKGTDWRVHACLDVGKLAVVDIQLTDHTGSETLTRFKVEPGDVLVGDRGYCDRRGILYVVESGADVVVRVNRNNLPVLEPDGVTFDLFEHLRSLKEGEVGDWVVKTKPSKTTPAIAGRLVAARKSDVDAEKERERLRREYKKKSKQLDPLTLEAAGYIFVFTTLSQERVSADEVLEIYRFRWQIEMLFKRMKSVVHLDEMETVTDESCRTFLLGKLLGVMLIEEIAVQSGAFSPCGQRP